MAKRATAKSKDESGLLKPAGATKASKGKSRAGLSDGEEAGGRSKRDEAAKPPELKALDGIWGQGRAMRVLESAIRSGHVHHAWVFHGPPGVGKFTTALSFAAILLDPTVKVGKKGEIEVDAASTTRGLIAAGSHPDLRIVTKELATVSRDAAVRGQRQRNIPKVVLEEFLIEPASRSASLAAVGAGSGKNASGPLAASVFIVDEADLIDATGQNALLKTLEEPAPGRVIILVTSAPEALLPTVLSRTQRVGFVPLGPKEMDRWLREFEGKHPEVTGGGESGGESGSGGGGLAPAQRGWVMEFADGSPGLAELALKTGLVQWHDALEPMLKQADGGKPPLELGETMAKLVDQWAEGWIEGKANASKEAAKVAAVDHMLRLVASHLRVTLRREAIAGKATDESGALRNIDLLRETERFLAANVQPGFAFEGFAAGMGA